MIPVTHIYFQSRKQESDCMMEAIILHKRHFNRYNVVECITKLQSLLINRILQNAISANG